jgi:hypothetical protein
MKNLKITLEAIVDEDVIQEKLDQGYTMQDLYAEIKRNARFTIPYNVDPFLEVNVIDIQEIPERKEACSTT